MTTGIFEALRVAKEYGLNREEKMSIMKSNDIEMKEEDAGVFVSAIAAAVLMGVIKKTFGEKKR
jgi:hypothetical protein